jgi:hypothetical protein
MTNDIRAVAPSERAPETSRGLEGEIALIRTLVRELYDDRDAAEGRIRLLLQAASVLTRMVAAHYKLGSGDVEQLGTQIAALLGHRPYQSRDQEDV